MEAREGSNDAVASPGTPPPFYPTPAPFYPAPPPSPAYYPSPPTTRTSHVPHDASDGADSNAVASSSTNDIGQASAPPPEQTSLPPWRRRGYVPPGNAFKALKGMPFTGVLTEDDISKLHDEFDDDLLCPGVTGRVFGNYADADGLVYLPGAPEGYQEARRVLRSWETQASTEDKFTWWPEVIQFQEQGRGPIMVSTLLSGLPKQEWLSYQAVYRRRSAERVERLAQERNKAKRKQRRAEAEAEAEVVAVAVAAAAVASMSAAESSGAAEGA